MSCNNSWQTKIIVTPVMIEAACQVRYKKWAAHNAKPEARATMRAILEAALSTPIQIANLEDAA